MGEEPYYPGLEGVIAGETAVSTIDDGLRYRGYTIEDLAEKATYLETAYLLLYGELPHQEQLADFQSFLAEASELPPAIGEYLAGVPLHVPMMDVLRTGISALGNFDAQLEDEGRGANVAKAVRLLAQIPLVMATRHRQREGLDPLEPKPELGYAANLLYLLTGRDPSSLEEQAMEVSLILYAEHEFNASTFTARVVTSTGADLYSAVTAAVGALKGPLHGGANEKVMHQLEEIESPAQAENWVREKLSRKERIMGFGHRVYKQGDPRAEILKDHCRQLAQTTGNTKLEKVAETVENIVRDEKNLPPNLDWPSARLYHYLGLDVDLYTPLFVASRVAGWAAHAIEQAETGRLIRPRSRYTGPEPREVETLQSRG